MSIPINTITYIILSGIIIIGIIALIKFIKK